MSFERRHSLLNFFLCKEFITKNASHASHDSKQKATRLIFFRYILYRFQMTFKFHILNSIGMQNHSPHKILSYSKKSITMFQFEYAQYERSRTSLFLEWHKSFDTFWRCFNFDSGIRQNGLPEISFGVLK